MGCTQKRQKVDSHQLLIDGLKSNYIVLFSVLFRGRNPEQRFTDHTTQCDAIAKAKAKAGAKAKLSTMRTHEHFDNLTKIMAQGSGAR